MSLMDPISCVFGAFSFYCVFCFYNFWCRTNQIISIMSLAKFGLTLDPLVRTLLDLFICVLSSPLLMSWGLTFSHQLESSPKVVDSLHSFSAQITDFPPSFRISFIVIVWLFAHSVSNRFIFSKNMIQNTPMSNILRHYNSVSGGLDTGAFIQWVNGREPQIH